ncbi:protein ALTERED PHOSPHATE STARVATION RESPONSE 1-like isoform X2 [Telopea speciosissima]|uniref:protein ALTERED PHOSPHATE STARVATION RESPONSE 1-like isoform X2 n=1 Tax=Telopea speciosissima TaxID=54955 RepID=UPI001CC36D8E|nr:protein ALTERED PHOSPHATE STARVATION RESPONSE 1-like isoform X2 [Telopea speciosissima]
MGCVASRIDKEERVQRCKERKRLMKQLVRFREQFAAAQIAYLQTLKNTGITLRQFTESETLELEDTPFGFALPPSPPPLPPSPPPPPPPPPPLSPDLRKVVKAEEEKDVVQEESIEIDEESSCTTPPPPPIPNSSWDFWDPFGPSSSSPQKSEVIQQEEEEDWAETKTEFDEEEQVEEVAADIVLNSLPEKPSVAELIDDCSSMVSWYTKDTADMAMVVSRNKKTLAGIMRELDDYFLKSSDGGKEIAVLLDINRGDSLYHNIGESSRKRCNSAKVFSSLSWSWSSRLLQASRDSIELQGPSETCKFGALCITLDKLSAEEQKLYEEVKEEELAKLEYEKKTLLLQKQEAEDQELPRIEKTKLSIECLQSDIMCLQQSISRTCGSILKLRDEELHPQLVELSLGLMHMWRKMYECHQVQNHIAQQMCHLTNHPNADPTTDYHRQATAQLETEVTAWYNSFCDLLGSQREYVRALNRWVQLTDCLKDDQQQSDHPCEVQALCEEWQLALDRLPDKVASEAIKSFVSVIHSIILQQAEERELKKKSDRLERRLHKELNSLCEMELKLDVNFTGNADSTLSLKHPLSVKRSKTEAFKKRVEDEKAKYLNSVQVSQAMTLNNLQTSLPNVFQALTGFSSVCTQAFEAIHSCASSRACHDGAL